MKRMMALLLGCLLCLCAAGAMAEGAVTLDIRDEKSYDIYPNGYIIDAPSNDLIEYKGPYIFTGRTDSESDTPIEFHANAYGQEPGNNQNVRYDVTFKNLCITAGFDATDIRFFADGVDQNAKNCTITINLSSISDEAWKSNSVLAARFPAFNNSNTENNNNVEILVHNVSGTLILGKYNKTKKEQIVSEGITLTYDTDDGPVTIDGNDENDPNNAKNLEINTISCLYNLTHVPTTATCTAGGKSEYDICKVCNRVYLNGAETTLDQLPTVGALGHDLTHVDKVPPTCTENGNIEYWMCTREGCGTLFADKEKTKELTPEEIILPMLVRFDDLPKTGDSSRLTGWLALLGACCAGLLCLNRRRG